MEYKKVEDNKVAIFRGAFGTYPGNQGFNVDIYYGDDYEAIVNQLQSNNWVDGNSRALLLRWTVYNYWNKRYMQIEANVEIPTEDNISTSFYINSVSLGKLYSKTVYKVN